MSLVIKNMAPEYSNTKAYTEGDFCVNADKPYKCIGDTSGEFDSSKWERCYLSEMMGGGTTVEEFKSIAQEYVSTNEYNEDDVILKDDKLYQCNTDGTTGSWDSDKWDEVLIPDISHNSNLANVLGDELVMMHTVLNFGAYYGCLNTTNGTYQDENAGTYVTKVSTGNDYYLKAKTAGVYNVNGTLNSYNVGDTLISANWRNSTYFGFVSFIK